MKEARGWLEYRWENKRKRILRVEAYEVPDFNPLGLIGYLSLVTLVYCFPPGFFSSRE